MSFTTTGVGSVTKGLTDGATVAAGGKGGLATGDCELMGLATPGGRVLLIPRDLPRPTAAAMFPTMGNVWLRMTLQYTLGFLKILLLMVFTLLHNSVISMMTY